MTGAPFPLDPAMIQSTCATAGEHEALGAARFKLDPGFVAAVREGGERPAPLRTLKSEVLGVAIDLTVDARTALTLAALMELAEAASQRLIEIADSIAREMRREEAVAELMQGEAE